MKQNEEVENGITVRARRGSSHSSLSGFRQTVGEDDLSAYSAWEMLCWTHRANSPHKMLRQRSVSKGIIPKGPKVERSTAI